jgi:hypothetical protein
VTPSLHTWFAPSQALALVASPRLRLRHNEIDVFVYTKFVQNPNTTFCCKPNTSLHITPLHPIFFRIETNLNKHMQLETIRKIKLGSKKWVLEGFLK